MVRSRRRGSAGTLAVAAVLACWAAPASGQPLTVAAAGGAVHVRAPGWSFLDGEPLARLKDGRTVRVEIVAMALAAPGRTPVAVARQIFSLSYDLWEERFAVTIADARAPAISHLTVGAAQAWCVEQLAISIAALAPLHEPRFWVRVEGRILDAGAADPDDNEGLTLQRIIDVLSRRRKNESPARAIEGGPFPIPHAGSPPQR